MLINSAACVVQAADDCGCGPQATSVSVRSQIGAVVTNQSAQRSPYTPAAFQAAAAGPTPASATAALAATNAPVARATAKEPATSKEIAQLMLDDARQWAERGWTDAAIDLVQRALVVPVQWQPHELSPQKYLRQLIAVRDGCPLPPEPEFQTRGDAVASQANENASRANENVAPQSGDSEVHQAALTTPRGNRPGGNPFRAPQPRRLATPPSSPLDYPAPIIVAPAAASVPPPSSDPWLLIASVAAAAGSSLLTLICVVPWMSRRSGGSNGAVFKIELVGPDSVRLAAVEPSTPTVETAMPASSAASSTPTPTPTPGEQATAVTSHHRPSAAADELHDERFDKEAKHAALEHGLLQDIFQANIAMRKQMNEESGPTADTSS